jgi:predicted kinase
MIVVILGLPGSGKSFFAEMLANRLHAEYINSDQMRFAMHRFGQYSFQDKLVIYRAMLEQVEKLLVERKSVVVDATFYRQDTREQFINLAKAKSVPIYFIEVVADEALIRERLKRSRPYSEADFAVYTKVRDEFEELSTPHLTLQSTNDNITSMLSEAIQYINNEGR